jgi:hypothetical protein
VLLHWPPPHWSEVQPMLSSQSFALQHAPQVAVPSGLGQHCWSLPQSGRVCVLHFPSWQALTVHGSLSSSPH